MLKSLLQKSFLDFSRGSTSNPIRVSFKNSFRDSRISILFGIFPKILLGSHPEITSSHAPEIPLRSPPGVPTKIQLGIPVEILMGIVSEVLLWADQDIFPINPPQILHEMIMNFFLKKICKKSPRCYSRYTSRNSFRYPISNFSRDSSRNCQRDSFSNSSRNSSTPLVIPPRSPTVCYSSCKNSSWNSPRSSSKDETRNSSQNSSRNLSSDLKKLNRISLDQRFLLNVLKKFLQVLL